jgi:hypothetical protein
MSHVNNNNEQAAVTIMYTLLLLLRAITGASIDYLICIILQVLAFALACYKLKFM